MIAAKNPAGTTFRANHLDGVAMRQPRLLIAAALLVGISAVISAWLPRLFDARAADAGEDYRAHVELVCQSNCTFSASTTFVDIDIVAQASAQFDVYFDSFEMVIKSTRASAFVPQTPEFRGINIGDSEWDCAARPPMADTGADNDPTTTESFIACTSTGQGSLEDEPEIPVTLASLRFDVLSQASTQLTIEDFRFYDGPSDEGSCNPTLVIPVICDSQLVVVGQDPLTPTETPSPTPTITPDPSMTPPGTPAGAVTDVLAIDSFSCALSGGGVPNVDQVEVLFRCLSADQQVRLQQLLECVNRRLDCGEPSQDVLQRVQPRDLSVIDRDLNQIRQGGASTIYAFVDGDYPVLFETDQGQMLNTNGQVVGASSLCFTAGPDLRPDGVIDPDCDANTATEGDGVVAMRVGLDVNAPFGPMTVKITQAGVSREIDLMVVGNPASITIESLDGRPTLETGAQLSVSEDQFANMPPADHRCDFVRRAPYSGATSPKISHLLVRVLDSNGTALVGSLVGFTDPTAPDRFLSLSRGRNAQGGTAGGAVPALDLGVLGAGAIQTVCGGALQGTLSFLVQLGAFPQLIPLPPTTSYSIDVVDAGPPLPAPTPCADDRDCDGVPDTGDNCVFHPNAAQANNDRNFIDNSPPFVPVTDDLTRIVSDELGDECDVDDDNDGLFDTEETIGVPCFAAAGATDPLDDDTDDDLFLDGAECSNQTDPLDAGDHPPMTECGLAGDRDGDMLTDRAEFCLYGGSYPNDFTNHISLDTDDDQTVDGGWDLCEVASLNGDRVVNSGDQGMLSRAVAGLVPYLRNIDINRDGAIKSGDQGLQAIAVRHNLCPLAPTAPF
jgi:hypothetical protein